MILNYLVAVNQWVSAAVLENVWRKVFADSVPKVYQGVRCWIREGQPLRELVLRQFARFVRDFIVDGENADLRYTFL